MPRPIGNLVVVSDLHAGCEVGLCPPRVRLDQGGIYHHNKVQAALWRGWRYVWDEWVPRVTHGEPFAVAVNGDAIDGRHHGATTQISANLEDQLRIAHEILAPVRDACQGRLYMVRGTEAHVGPAGETEAALGERLGTVPDETGNRTAYELWFRVGGGLVHLAHHIGTTGRAAYETSAPQAELTEMYNEAASWGEAAPDVVIRSHRHRYIETRRPSARGYAVSLTTPGWQGRTPFSYKIPGGRVNRPQFGAVLVRQGDEELFTRAWVETLRRSRTVKEVVV